MSFPDELENCNDYDPNKEIEWSKDTKRMFQGLKLLKLVENKIKELDKIGTELFNQGTQDYETDILQSLLQSLLDDSTKNEEVLR